MRTWLVFLMANAFATSMLVTAAYSPPNDFITKILAKATSKLYHLLFRVDFNFKIDKEVTFWCIKPGQTKVMRVILNGSDSKLKLDFSKPINLIIHGWRSGLLEGDGQTPDGISVNEKYSDNWMMKMAVNWAHFGDCNACIVDWSRLATFHYPIAAKMNTKLVAQHVVKFVAFLIQNGMNVEQMSIAGHSLGAQIAGHIGEAYPGKVAAIYGLDPAGLAFTFPTDFGIDERLNPTDAKYVQCVYTNLGVLGSHIPCGQGNFIMNDGGKQPGCNTPICSHSRATEYFTESLNPNHRFIAQKCGDVISLWAKEFFSKSCSEIDDQLGIWSTRKDGIFYTDTYSNPPYARNLKFVN